MQPPTQRAGPVVLPTHSLQGDATLHMYPTFSPDEKLLACGCDAFSDASLYLWDMKSGQRTTLASGPGADAIAFSPGNERIALGRDEEILVFAWPSGQLIGQVPFHRGDPDYLGLGLWFAGPDQVWVLYHPKGVWLWDLSRGQLKQHRHFRNELGHLEVGCTVAWLDGRLVLYTKLWDPEERSAKHPWAPADPRLRVELLETGDEILRTGPGKNPQFTPDLRHVLLVTDLGYGDCEVWDLVRGRCCGRIPAGTLCEGAYQARWPLSPEGRYVAWWDKREEQHRIKIWDTSQERLVQQIPTNGHYIPCAFSPTHRLLLTVAMTWGRKPTHEDRTMILDPLTGVCLGEAALLPFSPAPEFSPCGRWLALGVGMECYQWYDLESEGTLLLTDLASVLPVATPVLRGGA